MKRKLQILLLLLTLAVIWGHSLMPGTVSTAESDNMLALFHLFGLPVTVFFVRKAAHFTEFSILGLQLYLLLSDRGRTGMVRSVELGFLCAFLDETIQLLHPDRNGQIPDVWLDTAGVIFGTALAAAVLSLRRSQKEKR